MRCSVRASACAMRPGERNRGPVRQHRQRSATVSCLSSARYSIMHVLALRHAVVDAIQLSSSPSTGPGSMPPAKAYDDPRGYPPIDRLDFEATLAAFNGDPWPSGLRAKSLPFSCTSPRTRAISNWPVATSRWMICSVRPVIDTKKKYPPQLLLGVRKAKNYGRALASRARDV